MAEEHGSKKRKVASKDAVGGLRSVVSLAEQNDLEYIVTGLRAQPAMIPVLASVIRTGTLPEALFGAKSCTNAALGRCISSRLKTFGGLRQQFKAKMVQMWSKAADAEWVAYKFKIEQVDTLFYYALATKKNVALPQQHHGAGFEAPLQAVLAARYTAVGERLANLAVWHGDIKLLGLFTVASPVTLQVKCGTATGTLPTTQEHLDMATDWEIVNNLSSTAILSSKRLFCSFALQPLFELVEWPDETTSFEFPLAAEGFEAMANASIASASSSRSSPAPSWVGPPSASAAVPPTTPSRASQASSLGSSPPPARAAAAPPQE